MIQKTEFWAAHVAALKLKEISASEYAKQHHLAVKSLYWHKLAATKPVQYTKLTPQAGTKAVQSVQSKFVALQVAAPRQSHCTLNLPSGISALPEPEWLAAFDRAIQSMPELR